MALRALLLACLPSLASGQRITGTVVADAPRVPVSGAVVTLMDSAGRSLGRALTDANGRYTLALAPAGAQVRALRIGFRPGTSPVPPRTAGDVVIDLTMERAPAMLAPVRVAADASCRASEDGRLVLAAWEQARSALLAAIVAREARPARVELVTFERRMKPGTRLITEQRMSFGVGISRRPMAAARPPAALAAEGYMRRDGQDQVFYAPDADVLFDDSFGEAHCFGLVSGDADRRGQIGLSFTPRGNRRRDFADVRGTLWIDPRGPELRQLDYRYTGIDPDAERTGAGGTMTFRTMSNGVVFIDSWSIVIPALSEASRRGVDGRAVMEASVSELSESGGYVVNASWPDGTGWSDPLSAVRGQVREEKSGDGVAGVAISLTGAASTESDATGRYALGRIPPGRYELALIDSAFSNFTRPRQKSREITLTRGDTLTADFEVGPRAALLQDICRAQRTPGNTVALLGRVTDGSGPPPRDLRIEASWYSAPAGAASVGITAINQAMHVADVDDEGDFLICGIPRASSWIRVSARVGRATIADTTLEPSTRADDVAGTRGFAWTLPPGTFDAALRGDASVLSGRVVSERSPVPNVQVWVVLADTMVVTDSSGRFRIAGLPAGQHLIQLRRLGFDVKRDSVTLRRREETVREFTMDGVPQLDTMRTVADAMKYDVPRLQDFERRRLSGSGGHFIGEMELRRNEQRTVAELIRSSVPGLKIVEHRGRRVISSTSSPNMNLKALPNNGPLGCWVSVYLDGMLIFDGDGEPLDPPDMSQFFGLNLSGVEYYGSGANVPLQFKNIRNNCGTLLLWTRGR
ncbi:MAG TPA: carboxypeptidase-like regulatory domain-containing protein [Gemmatimonadaceae bacterium]|nr:carboxypeptidase-like regulatory domain-containing protein [Gemmatimonadaceae bacterium]